VADKENWTFGQGRPKGVKNKATRAIEEFLDSEMEGVLQAMVEAAKGGDAQAAKIVVSLRRPAARDRALTIALPLMASLADASKVAVAVAQAMLKGKLTPKEADDVLSTVERIGKIAAATDLEGRLQNLEKLTLKAAAGGTWAEL
jgi:hypothetical protein